MGCAGDQATNCGGSNLLQLYNNPDLATKNTINSGFTYQGCMEEVLGRALSPTSIITSNLTIENFSMSVRHLDTSMLVLNTPTNASLRTNLTMDQYFSNQCNIPCISNNGQICGGPNAITLYAYAMSRRT
ncbi:uncharacterized protein I206_104430 [Kwoniella pini CBS 10737]|uniref:Uncharacterized protein n=1 Tax=Kwoniella pini CBS 10737 TaxID=1296096 RepID=A0A1B9I1Z1_9TREE|nr:uncharacterized protein I206_03989 [Kwoniella pini CBS 10737]OCF49468.1 hypothetical protein I206_03989 [Kwoniella pini CBS 10737]